MRSTEQEPVFRGLHSLLKVIRDLIDRPRWLRTKPREGEPRGDRPLPLLCLIRSPNTNGFLVSLGARLENASPNKVPTQ